MFDSYPDIADTIGELLSINGFQILALQDVEAANSAFLSYSPNIAILDIEGGMAGVTLGMAIRRELGDKVLLIALTTGTGKDLVLATKGDFDLHLTKPFDPEALLATLKARRQRVFDCD